jgi:hypothetical protein
MAAVNVTISGTLYDKQNRTSQQVTLIGQASLTDVGVGGGPMPPGEGGGQPGEPDHIWGPDDPRPNPPIPIYPGGSPNPPEGPKPPEPTTPPIDWKVIWHPEEGWVVVGVPQFPHPSPSGQQTGGQHQGGQHQGGQQPGQRPGPQPGQQSGVRPPGQGQQVGPRPQPRK